MFLKKIIGWFRFWFTPISNRNLCSVWLLGCYECGKGQGLMLPLPDKTDAVKIAFGDIDAENPYGKLKQVFVKQSRCFQWPVGVGQTMMQHEISVWLCEECEAKGD